jgi:nucleoid-associated protein YgaU
MALEKLRIQVETAPRQFKQELTVLFNPNQITIQKTTNWREAPAMQRDVPTSQHTYAEPARLSMDLFFDTYEAATDVRRHTEHIAYLMTVEKHGSMHRPPVCRLLWGKSGVFFQGVLQNLAQRFTMFMEDGSPVRATLSCVFKEWRDEEEEARRQDKQSVDVVKTHVVRRGDTLSAIAMKEHQDPSLWRPIAEANAITDPLNLPYGRALVIPTLRTGESFR